MFLFPQKRMKRNKKEDAAKIFTLCEAIVPQIYSETT